MSPPLEDIGLTHLGYSTTDYIRLVGTPCRIGKVTSQGLLMSRTVPRTQNTLRKCILAGTVMVLGTCPPRTSSVPTTDYCSRHVF
jgi:hypothetical protein